MVRQTRSQKVILEILRQHTQPMSAQEIFVELRKNSAQSVGLATVYRALESLHNDGQLQEVNLGDHQAYYQLLPSSGHNRHHLICTNCRQVVPLSSCPVRDLEQQLSSKYEFVIDYHVLDFYGTCAACRA
ncbi:MAG: transcriptional repressor [Cyanobacteriota bacterium]|nr:transcriptional repressor [Cyanobacteriota bacterium]